MRSGFKIGDEVRVIKQLSKLRDLEGVIIDIRDDSSYLPIKVDMLVFGEWSFKVDDLELKNKTKPDIAKAKAIVDIIIDTAIETAKIFDKMVIEKPAKRPYKKRDKIKIEKPKRKYVKKIKP